MKFKSVSVRCCPVEFALRLKMIGKVDEHPFVALSWLVICSVTFSMIRVLLLSSHTSNK